MSRGIIDGVAEPSARGRSRPVARMQDGREDVAFVLRLCLGDGTNPPRTMHQWRAVYELARRERCAALAWLRSGDLIRACAPAPLVCEWRAAVVLQHEHGSRLLTLAAQALSPFADRQISAVIVKGPPLSALLYADPFVRPLDDLDVVIPREHWNEAVRILQQDGWQKDSGRQGWAEIYRRTSEGQVFRLDVQSSALVDHLSHLPELRGTVGEWRWGGAAFRTYVGPDVAVFLAVHLVKHQLPPLLWLVDFHTLWTLMTPGDRDNAMRRAREIRVHRYLEWAVARSSAVARASAGAASATRQLGFERTFRRDTYGMVRLAVLAGSPRDGLAVLGAWVWPRPMRYDWAAFRTMWQRRARRSVARVLSAQREYLDSRDRSDMNRGAHSPRVKHAHASFLLAGELIAQGSRWVLAEGNSMAPTLRTGDRVLLRYVQPADVRPGDIVAFVVSRDTVLHRVTRVSGREVWTRGDAMASDDRAASRENILGIAVVAERGRTLVALRQTLEFGVGAFARGVQARARLSVARAWRNVRTALSRPPVSA